MVVMALSTSSDSAMISAPSEMRCRSMSAICMIGNTIASVSGNDSATIRPARPPSATKLTTRMIAIACQSDTMNSLMAVSTTCGWFATSTGVMPTGRSAVMRADRRLDVLAQRKDVAAVAHGDGEADRRLAVDAEQRLRRIRVAAAHRGDVAQPQQPAVGDEIDVEQVLSESKAPVTRSANCSSPVRTTPAGRTTFCACSAGEDRRLVEAEARERSVENSRRSARPARRAGPIFVTSGTCSSCERTSST